MSAQRTLGLALLALSTGAAGCAAGVGLRAQVQSISERLDTVEKPAYKCAERALALSRSHVAFAIQELDEGDYFRASEHVDLASDAAVQAEAVARRPECQEDTDGDGIPDPSDRCPEQAEDMDGYEDEDGCPEDQDTDGDGIPDSRDQCPRDPEDLDGVDDEDGCPDIELDRDGDGIPDASDRCPEQPEDKDGFEDTDGCPDPDNDQDGVLDAQDGCPLQPEDKDGFEDENGCPDPDNDQDRIPDVSDKCPNQPEDYDGDEDTDGCPDIYKTIIVRDDRIELKQKVFFATAKARILERSFELLNEVSAALRERKAVRVRIEGHTDSRGSARYNKTLSQQRADSVRRYLEGQGIGSDRLESVGLGEDVPIEDNRTADGRAANRRVEFHIIK